MEVIMKNYSNDKRGRAKKRVYELKGFYIHFIVYVLVNIFIVINIYINSTSNFWQWNHFFTPLFWGIGVFFHASKVFDFNPLFNKDWEKRQIEKYMEQDKKETDKFTKR